MKITKTIAIIVTTAISGFGFITPTFADTDICKNSNVSPEVRAAAGCSVNGTTVNELDESVINVLNGIIAALGLLASIFIVVGGINYMTSAGDAAKLKKAKDTILYALIGMVICVLTFALVNFVIKKVIG